MPVATLTSFGRKERQKNNLSGLARIVLFGASQFTAAWPTTVTDGEVSVALPLKSDTLGAVVTFDIGSGRAKTTKSGPLGHQKHTHEMECNMAGVTKEASAAVAKTLNEGGVALCYQKDGSCQILGSSHIPLNFEHDSDTGAGDNDKNIFNFKGMSSDSMPWGSVFLADSVTVPLPAEEDSKGEPAWFSTV
jgi:hypothetical protein